MRMIDRLSREEIEARLENASKKYKEIEYKLSNSYKRKNKYIEKISRENDRIVDFENTMRQLSADIFTYSSKIEELDST